MKKFLILSAILCGLFLFPGCQSTLEPGGAYAPAGMQADKAFYAIDGAFLISANAIDTAFKFERDNRALLWKVSPSIKHGLDSIRPEAAQVVVTYSAARKAYMLGPTPTGLDTLRTILAKAQQVATAAQAAINVNQ